MLSVTRGHITIVLANWVSARMPRRLPSTCHVLIGLLRGTLSGAGAFAVSSTGWLALLPVGQRSRLVRPPCWRSVGSTSRSCLWSRCPRRVPRLGGGRVEQALGHSRRRRVGGRSGRGGAPARGGAEAPAESRGSVVVGQHRHPQLEPVAVVAVPEVGRVDERPCVRAGTPSRVPACSTSSRRVPRLGARGGRAEQAVGHSRRRRVGGRSGRRVAPACAWALLVWQRPPPGPAARWWSGSTVTRSWSP